MKLASIKKGRDGQLVLVNSALTKMTPVNDIAPTMQAALDNWATTEKQLNARYLELENGQIQGQEFIQTRCASPLPRAFQWADGSAYVNHVELVRKARNAPMPSSFWTEPLMYQGDFEAEVAVITSDVPMGVSAQDALDYILFVMIVNDVSLRGLIPGELAKGFGFFQSKPSSAFSPVCVTPDELGEAWKDGKVHLPLLSTFNDELFGKPNAGVDMTFNFGQLIAHAAKTRPLCAGTIIGSGTVSNKLDDGPGKSVKAGGDGYSCIAEIRMIETILQGNPNTEFMTFGDKISIEMLDHNGQSIFGKIEQTINRV